MPYNTTKLNSVALSTDSSGKYVPLVDANGAITRLAAADFSSEMLGSFNTGCLADGLFLAWYLSTEGKIQLARPEQYDYKANFGDGAVLIGIAIMQGGRHVIVPIEGQGAVATGCGFAPYQTDSHSGADLISDFAEAINDFNGKAYTNNYASGIGTHYAAGHCYNYAYGGLGAGNWFLPAYGQLMLIEANIYRLNVLLKKFGGTALEINNDYWASSTEAPSRCLWIYQPRYGYISKFGKDTADGFAALPVTQITL